MQIGDIRAHNAVINIKPDAELRQAGFKEGAIVTAEVLSTDGKQMTLRLNGGPVIRAVCEEGIALSKGDIISLQVMSAPDGEGGPVSMRLFGLEERASGRMSPMALQLARMGIEPGDRAVAVAEALARAGHGLSMKQLGDALGIMDRYPALDAAKAAFLALNNIQPDARTVDALIARTDGGQTLGRVLAELQAQLIGAADGENGLNAAARQAGTAQPHMPASTADLPLQGDGARDAASARPPISPENLPEAVTRDILAFAREMAGARAEGAQGAGVAMPPSLASQAGQAVAQTAGMLPSEASDHIAGFVMDALKDAPEDVQARFAALLGRAAADLQRGTHTAADIGRLIRGIERMFARAEEEGAEALRRAVDEAPGRLFDIRAATGELSGAARMTLAAKADQAMQQMKFSGDVQQYLYVQIPLSAMREHRTAELYVMRRDPRNRPLDPENVTIALALDTESLGRVETLIEIVKKDISLKFRLESEALVKLVQSLTVEAHHVMREAGYRLRELRAQTIKTPIDPVNVERVVREEFTRERRILDVTV